MDSLSVLTEQAAAEGFLHSWFLRGARIAPEATALRIGRERFSYRWLHERALALAGELTVRCTGHRPRRLGLLAAPGHCLSRAPSRPATVSPDRLLRAAGSRRSRGGRGWWGARCGGGRR